ncbi:MAG: Carbamate kinase [Candidatus Fermentimicrarchaeum limneticum]|uniref:Carbamate kinase n=1 Tax=Fermentimicrarchaeum limneticum TaxID=2795018 RepID=A0A7D5XCA1_FERL1|nr:MAG: Carbamate kinase [Candidatus Fermentimicrarchaeum limneticum]
MKTLVIALGGNMLLRKGESGTFDAQLENAKRTAKRIAGLIERGYRVVITHGNGPQVGNILIQQEKGRDEVPAMPLDVCVAESQGEIGYMLQRALRAELIKRGIKRPVATIVTQVRVDENDAAFKNPTKPIGPFYSKQEAAKLSKKTGALFKEDAGRGYRRVVPSPKPREIVEKDAVRRMIKGGVIVIASGGGGIPVVKRGNRFRGVEAVIDKDLAAAVLAEDVDADMLIILTDVKAVFLDYRGKCEIELRKTTPEDASRYMKEGHFAPGSMGPKVQAAIDFALKGGRTIITSPRYLEKALKGDAGTLIE